MKSRARIVIRLLCVCVCLSLVAAACKKKGDDNQSLMLLLLGGGQKPLNLSNFQEASLVLGQPDFNTRTATAAAPNTFSNNYSQPAVAGGRLYLADEGWNRILVFDSFPTVNNQNADAVLGQADFVSTTANRGVAASADTTLYGPHGVSTYGNKFLITDYSNHRILIYNSIPTAYDATADVVAGQPDFITTVTGSDGDSFHYPEYACFAAGKLIVADSNNNRVLIFNSIPATNGASADIVLGQGDFTHVTENDDDQNNTNDGSPTARTMNYPLGIWSDGKTLLVSEGNNNRVLIWNSFPTASFQPADVVVGQASMTANASAAGADGLNSPYFITVHAGQLFVADMNNHRVLIFNSIPVTNGASADTVLGQGDFTHVTWNDDDQNNSDDGSPTARTMYYPTGVCAINGKLIVADMNNYRFLVYESQ